LLQPRKRDRLVHDLGFIFLNTYRRWFQATPDPALMDVVVEAGITLSQRFQEKGQYLASFLGINSLFVDIMMNVPLLYVAADWLESEHRPPVELKLGERIFTEPSGIARELRRRATAHCLTSQRLLVRPDGSTVHEAIFQTETGQFLRESTQQGLRPDSCWSRGLAWALYGFGTAYRHTGDRQFLDTADRCAAYFLARLPAARVPYWDFDVPEGPDRLWDSSAAAIAASGLLQLAEIGQDLEGEMPPANSSQSGGRTSSTPASAASLARYRIAALEILDALCQDEFLTISRPEREGILDHAVYHFHKKLGVGESVMWGDHFFVEALVKALEQLETR
jgi:unsaturated chondroitin disaccharide hydrolase